MSNINTRLMVASIMAAASSGIGALANSAQAIPIVSRPQSSQVRRSTSNPTYTTFGYASGPGWTAAQVKRMAKKRRNKIMNKKHGGAA